jgi:carboxypeptidase Taq
MQENAAVKTVVERYSEVWALTHSMALLSWDMETHMPEAASRSRGMASGQLAMMSQKATLALKGPLGEARRQKGLSDREKGIVRVLSRQLDYYEKIPPRLVDEIERATTEATMVWRTARKRSNFKLFQPHLEKIVELKREVAEKLGYSGHPYNALLDLYEEGFTVRDADAVFSRLIPGTRKIADKVSRSGLYPSKHPLESKKYSTEAMAKVNEGILKLLRMPMDRFRMDVSTHPFTIDIAPDDVRITTRYEGVDFKATMFSTIHESGHALYELGIAEDLRYTPVGHGASLGMHESQSRFWENAVGRSKGFAKLASPMLRRNLAFLAKYDTDDLYRYFNVVRKSFIRVDADELTYNLHIALRYEIEKKLIAGEVKVSELPDLWDDTFEGYFGKRPRSDSEGVLQDIHWSGGSLGYFATYSLGNVILGMIWHKMGDGDLIAKSLEGGDPSKLRGWLVPNIHSRGSIYAPKVLQRQVFGETYNPERLIKYLETKFLK